MAESRLQILPHEILHLEIECHSCRTVTVLPLSEPDYRVEEPGRRTSPGRYAFESCLWCGEWLSQENQVAISQLREGLDRLRRNREGSPILRLIVKP